MGQIIVAVQAQPTASERSVTSVKSSVAEAASDKDPQAAAPC